MDELEARIEALERAVTDGDRDLSELAAEGETRERLAALEDELDDLADRVAELEAATQALRGYVGNVRAVNTEIEQRADAALAKAESLESAVVDGGDSRAGPPGASTDPESRYSPGVDGRTGGREDAGGRDTVEAGGRHGERCRACGQPSTRSGEHNPGDSGHRAGPTTNGDQLDAVFESEPENAERGTFDRIREML